VVVVMMMMMGGVPVLCLAELWTQKLKTKPPKPLQLIPKVWLGIGDALLEAREAGQLPLLQDMCARACLGRF
jgi:hypothetical protein